MKLDQLLGQLQAQSPQQEERDVSLSRSVGASTSRIAGTTTSSADSNNDNMYASNNEKKHENACYTHPILPNGLHLPWLLQGLMSSTLSAAPILTSQSEIVLGNGVDSATAPVPLSPKEAAQGIMAIGGCRQCARTFTDRLELIHHFVDHFPHYFYSFEPLKRTSSRSGTSEGGATSATNMSTPALPDRLAAKPAPYFEPATPSPQIPITTSFDFAAMLGLRNIAAGASAGGSEGRTKASSRTMAEKSQKIPRRKPSSSGLHEESSSKIAKVGDPASTADRAESTGGIDLPYHMCPHCCLTFSDGNIYYQHLATHDSLQEEPENLTLPVDNNGDITLNYGGHWPPAAVLTVRVLRIFWITPSTGLTATPSPDEMVTAMVHLTYHQRAAVWARAAHGDYISTTMNSCRIVKGINLILRKTTRCKFCDARFSNLQLMAEHERLHCHICPLCEKTFTTMFDLNLHAGTHTGFTYDCKDCGRCFLCRKSLAEHNKIHRVLVNNEEQLGKELPGQDVTISPAIAIGDFAAVIANSSHLSPSTTSSSDNSTINGSTPNNFLLNRNPYFGELLAVNGTRKRRITKAPKNCGAEKPHRALGQ